jgi:hypothetical protein
LKTGSTRKEAKGGAKSVEASPLPKPGKGQVEPTSNAFAAQSTAKLCCNLRLGYANFKSIEDTPEDGTGGRLSFSESN